MRKQQWDEEKIASLLKRLPEIKDERNPQSIYRSVEAKIAKKNRKVWMIPSFATAFTLLLAFIIGNSLGLIPLTDKSINLQHAESESKEDAANEMFSIKDDASQDSNKKSYVREDLGKKENASLDANAVYIEEANNKELLTYPVPDKNVQVIVPITILVNKEENRSKFDLYKEYASQVLNNTSNYLNSTPLFDEKFISFDADNQILKVDVDKSLSNVGSGGSDDYFYTLINQQLETIGAKKIQFYTNGEPGMVIGNREEAEVDYKPLEKRGYFILSSTLDMEQPLYVPWEKPYAEIEEALEAMEEDKETYGLSASIPETMDIVNIEKNEQSKQLTIYFSDDSKMEENRSTLQAIESMLLTAKEFHYSSVKFENTKIPKVGSFSFSKELQVPLAANKREF